MTNEEYLRTATREELAAFLHNAEVRTVICALTGSPVDQEIDLIDWLQEEREDGKESND